MSNYEEMILELERNNDTAAEFSDDLRNSMINIDELIRSVSEEIGKLGPISF